MIQHRHYRWWSTQILIEALKCHTKNIKASSQYSIYGTSMLMQHAQGDMVKSIKVKRKCALNLNKSVTKRRSEGRFKAAELTSELVSQKAKRWQNVFLRNLKTKRKIKQTVQILNMFLSNNRNRNATGQRFPCHSHRPLITCD